MKLRIVRTPFGYVTQKGELEWPNLGPVKMSWRTVPDTLSWTRWGARRNLKKVMAGKLPKPDYEVIVETCEVGE